MSNPDEIQTIQITTADQTVEVPRIVCEQSNVIKKTLDQHGWDKSVTLKSLTGEMLGFIADITQHENIPEQLQPLDLALLDGIKETASFLEIQPLYAHIKNVMNEKIHPTASTLLNSKTEFLTNPQFLVGQYLNIDTLGTVSFDVGTEIMHMLPELKTWILRSMCPCRQAEDEVLSQYTHPTIKKHPITFSTMHNISIEPSDALHDVSTYLNNLITIEHALLLSCIYDAHTKSIPFNFADHPWLSIHFKKLNEDLQKVLLENGAILLLSESPTTQEVDTQTDLLPHENPPHQEIETQTDESITNIRSDCNNQTRSSHIYLLIPFFISALAVSSYLMYQNLKKE